MPDNNKAILVQANAAIIRGDYEGFLSFCTDDTIWTFVGDKTLKGKEAVRQYMATAYKEPPKFSVSNMIAEEEFVTAIGTITLTTDNKEEDFAYCDVWRFRNRRMAELQAFVIKSII